MKLSSLLLLILVFFCAGCSNSSNTTLYDSENLVIRQLSPGVWLHTSYLQTQNFGKVPCNGLIYTKDQQAMIFDTPTNAGSSEELITFLNSKKLEITGVIPTHFHIDCLGGLEVFHDAGIHSFASEKTLEFAKLNQTTLPQSSFKDFQQFDLGSSSVTVKHFGAGHTRDNVVVYLPKEHVLFGGCLVKSMNSGKGNLNDADTVEWPKTIKHIQETYPDIQIVIPGHGAEGGLELLEYTASMFQPN